MNSINRIFYNVKPLIPRSLQIILRRRLVLRKRKSCNHIWPIDEKAGNPPDGWSGWPNQKGFALILMHDVDIRKGHDNCYQLMNLEKSLGFRSSFNFVPERYKVSQSLRNELTDKGFEVGVHGLKHDGKLFLSKRIFRKRAVSINHYLQEWGAEGFSSPSMHHNLNWMHALKIKYDTSTFDTDPFEPQPDGVGTIFPFWIQGNSSQNGYMELPYTLPQDCTIFILMREKNINIWKLKLDWIAKKGGMALLNTHPDYMSFDESDCSRETYPARYYIEFLEYINKKYANQYWHTLPGDIAHFWKSIIT